VGGSAVKAYGYDLAGRTTSVVSPDGTTNIAYDFEGRATSITGPGVSQTNTYNGLDTRVGSTTNSVARSFLRDGAYVTDPVLSDGAATYTTGVSERRGSTTTYLHSGLKNADAQSSPAQALTGTRQYDAFGNLATSTGTWTGPFGYAGGFGYQEDATGLRLLGHRLYDASTGRFLTRDPIKDGRNWYAYCESDPISFADPNGLRQFFRQIGVSLVPGLGSVSATLVRTDDLDTGHIGVGISLGGGPGVGLSGGPYVGGGYDDIGSVRTGKTHGGAVGISILWVACEALLADLAPGDPAASQLTGGGINFGPGKGASAYAEKRVTWTLDLTQLVEDGIGFIKNLF